MKSDLDPQALQELGKRANGVFQNFFRILVFSIIFLALVVTIISRKVQPFISLGIPLIYLRLGFVLISILGTWVGIIGGWKLAEKTVDSNADHFEQAINRVKKMIIFRFFISQMVLDLGFVLFLFTWNGWDFYGLTFLSLFGFLSSFLFKERPIKVGINEK